MANYHREPGLTSLTKWEFPSFFHLSNCFVGEILVSEQLLPNALLINKLEKPFTEKTFVLGF